MSSGLLPTAAALILLVPLIIPTDLRRLVSGYIPDVPFEWALLTGFLLLVPQRHRRWTAAICGALLALVLLVKLVDTGSYAAYGRPFNYALDLHLIPAGFRLLAGSIGQFSAGIAVLAGCMTLIAAAVLLGLATYVVARAGPARGIGAGLAGAAALGGLGFGLSFSGHLSSLSGFPTARLVSAHASATAAGILDLASFRQELSHDPSSEIPDGELLSRLRGKDVLLIFVESYGRAALDQPLFAEPIREVLASAESELETVGFRIASAWLTSPTVGGQSWLAHGTLLSGLRIDNQGRYDRLVTSNRRTLVGDFSRAGWRTVAVVPAISMAWPEGEFFGYDRIYDAHHLGYQGEPFNWVTMPDQYTLAAFETRERSEHSAPPIFAEIALISSHAPWTPIPPIIDWAKVEDGRVFNAWADSGEPPEVLWRDMDKVRVQYRRSLKYVIETLSSYLVRFGDKDLVAVVVGDHQAAPIITGDPIGREVPVHVISADPDVVRKVEAWGFNEGLTPRPDALSLPMEDLRLLLLSTFSGPASAPLRQNPAGPVTSLRPVHPSLP